MKIKPIKIPQILNIKAFANQTGFKNKQETGIKQNKSQPKSWLG